MNLALLLSSLVTVATATKLSVVSLGSAEIDLLQQELNAWKATFGREADQRGLLPPQSHTESLDNTDEIQRLLDSKLAIEQASRANPEAMFGLNVFSLLTAEEFASRVKVSFGSEPAPTAATEALTLESVEAAIPDQVDWSSDKCNPSVKSQGQCGSCWAFSTLGVTEFAHCLATGDLLDLSEQQIVSCSTTSFGCNGGIPSNSLDWIRNGVCYEKDWPYTAASNGVTGTCDKTCNKLALAIGATKSVTGDAAIAGAVANQLVTVVVEAGNPVWQHYTGGVVSQCPGNRSDHAVIAVGYTSEYFKIKNSWGANWGENGYIRLKRGASGLGMCNVAERGTFSTLAVAPSPAPTTAAPKTAAPTATPTLPPTTTTPRPTAPSTLAPTTATPTTRTPTTAAPKPSVAPIVAPTPQPSARSTPAPTSSIPPPAASNLKDQLIAQTNRIRAAHQLGPITWDATLAVEMQKWADSCPGFNHGGPKGAQNLASFTPCGPGKNVKDCLSIVGASWLWYNQEETYWNYGSNSCNGDWAKCGHFSNMMNPDMKTIACGWSECTSGNYVWCNYDPFATNPKVPVITPAAKAQLKTSLTQWAQPPVSPSTSRPTATPTAAPTAAPTLPPTSRPTAAPTAAPTVTPTATPTAAPTTAPTLTPTDTPTAPPTAAPTAPPTTTPTAVPTIAPTVAPTPTATSGTYEQCGGIDYTGSKLCGPNDTCKYLNAWYSQCLPKKA